MNATLHKLRQIKTKMFTSSDNWIGQNAPVIVNSSQILLVKCFQGIMT